MEKNCEQCGSPFDAKRSDKKYCSSRCKSLAWEKKPLGTVNLNTQENAATPANNQSSLFPAVIKETERRVPEKLPADAQFIIDTLKEDKAELKDKVKELTVELKTVTKERNDFEKELDKTKSDLNAKPTALQGFVSGVTIDHVISLVQGLPAGVKALQEMAQGQSSAPAVAGLPAGEESPLMKWITAQPDDIQKSFFTMVNGLMKYNNPAALKATLNQMQSVTLRVA